MRNRFVAIEEPIAGGGEPKVGPFATGMLFGATVIGAAWAVVAYIASKQPKAASAAPVVPAVPATQGNCYVCLEPNTGTIPTGVTQIVSGTYRGYPYSTYFINNDFKWGATIDYGNGHNNYTYNESSAAVALTSLQKDADDRIAAGTTQVTV